MAGCDCGVNNCTCPINCNGPQCPKDQLVCYNKCINYSIDGRGTQVINFLRATSISNSFDVSICVTNEGPSTVTVAFINSSGVGGVNPVNIPPQSGALIVAQNVFGGQLFIGTGNVNDTARGQLRYEAQQTIKVNC